MTAKKPAAAPAKSAAHAKPAIDAKAKAPAAKAAVKAAPAAKPAVKPAKAAAPAPAPAAKPAKAAGPASKPTPAKAAAKVDSKLVKPVAKAAKPGKKGAEIAKKGIPVVEEVDLGDIEADIEGEVEVEVGVGVGVGDDKETKAKPLRMKVSRAKERALMREFGLEETTLTEEEATKRRQELKTLIKMGKTRGFLTHQEINDHLPEKLINEEILEAIISMLNDMGIAVYEQAPDAATLLVAGGGATTATEEEAEEAAEAALSTVDSEFGRTTDPVRMYMREMGTVELLTREGEIEIAKRIEGGRPSRSRAHPRPPRAHSRRMASPFARNSRNSRRAARTRPPRFGRRDGGRNYRRKIAHGQLCSRVPRNSTPVTLRRPAPHFNKSSRSRARPATTGSQRS